MNDVLKMLATPGEVEKRAKAFLDAEERNLAAVAKLTKARNLDKALAEAIEDRKTAAKELENARAKAGEALEKAEDRAEALDEKLKAREKAVKGREDAVSLREKEVEKLRANTLDLQKAVNERKAKVDAEVEALEARKAAMAAV